MRYERTIALIFFTLLIAMLVNVHGIRQTVIKQKYEKQLEVQQAEYQDAVIDLRQELHDARFQLDMATDHIELINAGH